MGSIINRGTKAEPKWYVKYKDADGRQKMVRTRVTSKAKAREFLRSAEQNVDMGRVGIEKRGTEKSFAELGAHWLEVHSATLESHADNVGRMEHLTKAFGKLPLSGVTAERVALLRARMAAETVEDEQGDEAPRWRPSTVNRVLALLRKVLNDGVSWGWVRSAPKVKLLPVPETAFDFLKRDEAERFLSHVAVAAPNDAALYTTAIYTGARMGELWGLRWADVSLRAVQTMLGHSTIQVTEKYAHLAPDFQEREADRLKLDVQVGLGNLVALDGAR